MTQQQIVKLLDLPERTLRDWKKSRVRLYALLGNIDYKEAKIKISKLMKQSLLQMNSHETYNILEKTKNPTQPAETLC